MKSIFIFFLSFLLAYNVFAQVPKALNYQAVARRNDGSIIATQTVGIRFSILSGGPSGSVLYQETHQTITNNYGLFTLSIGKGISVSGSFSAIDWSTGNLYLKVEIALQGGTNYQLQGTTQLLSVPYALYAEKSGNPGTQGPAGPQGPMGPIGPVGPQGLVGATGSQGSPGLQGPQGSAGPQGTNGSNGKTVLSGTANPASSIGTDGDFYINTSTNQIFGPKVNGNWGSGVSLTGPAGSSGLKSLLAMEYFTATATCPQGGITIKSGIDQNNNNNLDAGEVDNTKNICFTQSTNPLDKCIIIPINFSANTTSTTPVKGIGIPKFNKMNYPGVDSIILVCSAYVGNVSGTAVVELFNITDNVAITNSTINSNTLFNPNPQGILQSANVVNNLPNYEVSLGVSLKSSVAGLFAATGPCYLYLYRH